MTSSPRPRLWFGAHKEDTDWLKQLLVSGPERFEIRKGLKLYYFSFVKVLFHLCGQFYSVASPGWTEVDICTPRLIEAVPEIDAHPVRFYRGYRGSGHIWSLTGEVAKYGERGEFTASVWHQKLKSFQIKGGSVRPGPRWGFRR